MTEQAYGRWTLIVIVGLSLVVSGCATPNRTGATSPRAKIEDIGSRKPMPTQPSPDNKTTVPNTPSPAAPSASVPAEGVTFGTAPSHGAIVGRDLPQMIPNAIEAERPRTDAVPPVASASRSTPPAPADMLAKLTPLPARDLPVQANRAVSALLDTAQKQARSGQTDAAVATLERALSIEPRNGVVWNRLAELHLQLGHYAQASQMAAKSNVLVQQPTLQAHNWRIVALAKEAGGDTRGARAAQQHAEQLEAALP